MKIDRIGATATGGGGLALLGGLSAFVSSASWDALVAVGLGALLLVACACLLWSVADLPLTPATRIQSLLIAVDNAGLCVMVPAAVSLGISYLHPAIPLPVYSLAIAFLLIFCVVCLLIRHRFHMLGSRDVSP